MQIDTHIDIAAPPDAVWRVLTDFARYGAWNPFMPSIEGAPRSGERLRVRIAPPGGRPMTFAPEVLEAAPGRALVWRGKVLGAWLFEGVHAFRLEATPTGTRLHHGERFRGLLVPLMRRNLDGPTREGFLAMNRALKAEAEQQAGTSVGSPAAPDQPLRP